jgi:hypothetical protein
MAYLFLKVSLLLLEKHIEFMQIGVNTFTEFIQFDFIALYPLSILYF